MASLKFCPQSLVSRFPFLLINERKTSKRSFDTSMPRKLLIIYNPIRYH
ncbi:hypothetical protein [Wolbachia endosymbiont (group A) of Volucella inflata]|nr:hypothetical protein [Wolbachia endosymbiont (group A) of Volucella inflata]